MDDLCPRIQFGSVKKYDMIIEETFVDWLTHPKRFLTEVLDVHDEMLFTGFDWFASDYLLWAPELRHLLLSVSLHSVDKCRLNCNTLLNKVFCNCFFFQLIVSMDPVTLRHVVLRTTLPSVDKRLTARVLRFHESIHVFLSFFGQYFKQNQTLHSKLPCAFISKINC